MSAHDAVDGSPTGSECREYRRWGGRNQDLEEPSMEAVTTVGLDIAKSVFQVHGVDCGGKVLVRRQLKRRQVLPFFEKLPRCLVGMEACATSHHWSRELKAFGHTLKLMPPAYVKPYVKGRRTMPQMRRRSAKRLPGQICGSSRPRRPSSRAV